MPWIEVGLLCVGLTGLLLAAFFWRKATHLHQVLTSTVASSDGMQSQLYRLQGELKKKQDQAKSRVEKLQKTELQLQKVTRESLAAHSEKDRAESRRLEVENRANILIERYKEETLAAQAEVAQQQERNQDLSHQLKNAETVKTQLLQEEQQRHRETATRMKAKLSEQQDLYNDLEKSLNTLRKGWVDPQDHLRLKKKLASYQKVYQVLKGQKDMSEERADNWRVGLLKLASWALQQQKQVVPQDPAQCVMAALKLADVALVHDEFVQQPDEKKLRQNASEISV